MTTKQKTNRANETLHFTKIVAGVLQHVVGAIVLGGKSWTAQAIAAVFEAYIQAEKDLDAARAVVATKLAARKATLLAARALAGPIHDWAKATYGADSPVMIDFGFTQAKPADKPVAVRAKAAEKGSATRARHKAALEAPPAPTATTNGSGK